MAKKKADKQPQPAKHGLEKKLHSAYRALGALQGLVLFAAWFAEQIGME